jgi:hypothetical protein
LNNVITIDSIQTSKAFIQPENRPAASNDLQRHFAKLDVLHSSNYSMHVPRGRNFKRRVHNVASELIGVDSRHLEARAVHLTDVRKHIDIRMLSMLTGNAKTTSALYAHSKVLARERRKSHDLGR